jgi:hypothetical protein
MSLSNLTDHYDLGFEEPSVGKKLSRLSLLDDAFGADVAISRCSRVMGPESIWRPGSL